jgi:hypothetical protein
LLNYREVARETVISTTSLQGYRTISINFTSPRHEIPTPIGENTSNVQRNISSDQLPGTTKHMSSRTSGLTSVEEELAKVGIFLYFHKKIGTGRSSIVYEGKANCPSKPIILSFPMSLVTK